MGTTIVKNPPPPPIPKLVLFAELITLAAVVYLIALTTRVEGQLEDLQLKQLGEREGE